MTPDLTPDLSFERHPVKGSHGGQRLVHVVDEGENPGEVVLFVPTGLMMLRSTRGELNSTHATGDTRTIMLTNAELRTW